MKPTLFKFKEGIIDFATEEIALYPEFARILHRDTTSAARMQAKKEFHYIWLVADYQSPLIKRGLTGKKLTEEANLESGANVKSIDADIKKAIAKYKELQYDIREEYIMELLSLFKSQLDRIRLIRGVFDEIKGKANLTLEQVSIILDKENELFIIATKTPAQIRALNNALSEIDSMDNKDGDELRGGGVIPDSALPERTL